MKSQISSNQHVPIKSLDILRKVFYLSNFFVELDNFKKCESL